MEMYDRIGVFQPCPFCGELQRFVAETKDLDCLMYTYESLPKNWYSDEWGRKFRAEISVFKKFPKDKAADVWKNQAEWIEAAATIPDECIGKLNYVDVSARCVKCGKRFTGKIQIKDGKLFGQIVAEEVKDGS